MRNGNGGHKYHFETSKWGKDGCCPYHIDIELTSLASVGSRRVQENDCYSTQRQSKPQLPCRAWYCCSKRLTRSRVCGHGYENCIVFYSIRKEIVFNEQIYSFPILNQGYAKSLSLSHNTNTKDLDLLFILRNIRTLNASNTSITLCVLTGIRRPWLGMLDATVKHLLLHDKPCKVLGSQRVGV